MKEEKNKYKDGSIIVGMNEPIGHLGLEDLFFDTEHLRVLYFLAKENPKITEKTLSSRLKIKQNTVSQILSNLVFSHLAIREEPAGFTLTQKGLATLYNFHINYAAAQ